ADRRAEPRRAGVADGRHGVGAVYLRHLDGAGPVVAHDEAAAAAPPQGHRGVDLVGPGVPDVDLSANEEAGGAADAPGLDVPVAAEAEEAGIELLIGDDGVAEVVHRDARRLLPFAAGGDRVRAEQDAGRTVSIHEDVVVRAAELELVGDVEPPV